MGGERDEDEDSSLAYRLPAPGTPEVEPPSSWRKPSSKVLGALARLTEAKTGVPASAPVAGDGATREDSRPARTRIIGDVGRPLPRCAEGHQSFVAGDFVTATERYERWRARARLRRHDELDRLEVCVMLAVLRRSEGSHGAAGIALQEALSMKTLRYRAEAPLAGALVLAGAFRDLGMNRASRALLATRAPEAPNKQGAQLLRAQADDALAHGEIAQCVTLAEAALSIWNGIIPASSREHIATRLTLARAHIAAERWATADRALQIILKSDDRRVDPGLTARAWSAFAEMLFARGSGPEDALSSTIVPGERAWPGPFAAKAPVLRTRARIFEALGRSFYAREARAELQAIEATHPACLIPELG